MHFQSALYINTGCFCQDFCFRNPRCLLPMHSKGSFFPLGRRTLEEDWRVAFPGAGIAQSNWTMFMDGRHLTNSHGQWCVFLLGSDFVPGGIVFHPHKGNSCLSHSQVMAYNHPAALKHGSYMHTLYAYRHTCIHRSFAPHTQMLHTKLIEEKIRAFFPVLLMPENPNIAAGESRAFLQHRRSRPGSSCRNFMSLRYFWNNKVSCTSLPVHEISTWDQTYRCCLHIHPLASYYQFC